MKRYPAPPDGDKYSVDWFDTANRFFAGDYLISCDFAVCQGLPLTADGKRWSERLTMGHLSAHEWAAFPRSGKLVADFIPESGTTHPREVSVLDLDSDVVSTVPVPDGWTAWAVDDSNRAVLLRHGDTVAVWWPGSDPVPVDHAIRSAGAGDAGGSDSDGVGWQVDGRDFIVWQERHDLLGRPYTEIVTSHAGEQHAYTWGHVGGASLHDGVVKLYVQHVYNGQKDPTRFITLG